MVALKSIKKVAEKYIYNLEYAFKTLKKNEASSNKQLPLTLVLDSASRYLKDAKYYLENEDDIAALASASYSEGLLDALKLLKVIKISWKERSTGDD